MDLSVLVLVFLMTFSNSKCKDLHLCWVRSIFNTDCVQNFLEVIMQRRTWRYSWIKNWVQGQQCVLAAQKTTRTPGCTRSSVASMARERKCSWNEISSVGQIAAT